MCADFSIHDTDGHNPHAHIILTMRPLDENGKWQNKTEKEYICVQGEEEKEFTAAEFREAQTHGWEKQYKYKVGKRKIYMAPSKAEAQGYDRISKYPKSTKFGRQNPITERWNSEEQLIKWREAWADVTNQILKEQGVTERIDHRSFKDRGITEQPTIHEGVSSHFVEKQGIISERRGLNRQIKDDNQLLRKLKSEYEEIAVVAKNSIPETAKAMETIFANLIVCRYNQIQAKKAVASYGEWLNAIRPDYQKYTELKEKNKSKKSELRNLEAKRKAVSKLNVMKQAGLSKEITALTEDIEELKSELSNLLLYYGNETEFKKLCTMIPAYEEKKKKQTELQNTLKIRIAEQSNKYLTLKYKQSSDDGIALNTEWETFHTTAISNAIDQLQTIYKDKFDYHQFTEAKSYIAASLDGTGQQYSIKQHLLQSRELIQQEQTKKATQKNKNFFR